jgi:glycosyltransferase involved in cell wall biosynthesis
VPGYILFVGTLEPRKNIPMLLTAYAMMRSRHDIKTPLILVGGRGWLYDEVFDTIRNLSLEDHVRHLEGVSDAELVHLYHGAGVLASPSTYEGFGLPALEAMHCGCPVIASEGGSLPEVVGQAGILLEPEDVDGWAVALATVLMEPGMRARLAAAGRDQAARFSWERTAQETLLLYRGAA